MWSEENHTSEISQTMAISSFLYNDYWLLKLQFARGQQRFISTKSVIMKFSKVIINKNNTTVKQWYCTIFQFLSKSCANEWQRKGHRIEKFQEEIILCIYHNKLIMQLTTIFKSLQGNYNNIIKLHHKQYIKNSCIFLYRHLVHSGRPC